MVARLAPLLSQVLHHSIFDTLDTDEIETLVDLLERIEAAARTCAVDDERGGE